MLDSPAMDRLQSFSWPGNVRELKNLVRRLAALYSQDTIGIEVIEAELSITGPVQPLKLPANNLASAMETYLEEHFTKYGSQLPPPGLYGRVLSEVERPLITMSLALTRGNQVQTANLLGLNRNTLRKKIRELKIPVTRKPK